MDPTQSQFPINIDPDLLQKMNEAHKKYMKDNPVEYLAPKDVREFLEEILKVNPKVFSINEDGKIVIDINLIPENLRRKMENHPLIIVTDFNVKNDTTQEKPFGMK